MALWHLRAQIIGRSKGKSAVAAAAYRAGESLHSEHVDMQFDYSKKRGIEFSEILLPEGAPEWMKEREKLWNAVESFEKRKDATLAREIEVALPAEFTLEEQKALLREYISDNFLKVGMIADYAIHNINGTNPHSHIMLTLRPIVNGVFGKKERAWNDPGIFERWREEWANLTNKHLALNGIDQRISHLSYAARGIDLEPTLHEGRMARDNVETLERFEKIKAIKERNKESLFNKPEIAIDFLTRHESIFNHEALAKFVNKRTSSIQEFNKLKLAIESSKALVSLGTGLDGKEYYTSNKVLEQERNLIDKASNLSKSNIHQLNPEKFAFIIKEHSLNVEQTAAFKHVLSDNDLSLIVGFAGTGKSYLMNAMREAYESRGYRVLGTALSGRAADGLRQTANIDSKTIARFLIDWENGREQLNNKTVLIIDEIGMVGTRQLQALLQEADRAGAKVIGCGDPEQILPIEAGCSFRFLLERMPHVFLKEVMRQKEGWQKEATVEFSTRKHGRALDRYKEHGCVFEHDTRLDALDDIVSRWHSYTKLYTDKLAVIMSYRNRDVLEMNLRARQLLKKDGLLSSKQSAKIQTATFGALEFATGDRVMFLRNDNQLQVKNGCLGKIRNIKGTALTVELDRGDTISFDARKYNELAYGYASTIHKLQGETVDKSFVLATPHFDRFLANVAMDRHRDSVELHYGLDDFKGYNNLKRTLSRGESKILAVEFAQARGLDYELSKDKAAFVESQTDFASYHEKLLSESQPIKGGLADVYLSKQLGLSDIDIKSISFHPAVWEKQTQDHMPALLAKAVGYDNRGGVQDRGVQVTFLDSETANKANLEHPVCYSGSSNAIVMLQKSAVPDNRWYLALDLETGLTIKKANPNIKIACLATQEKFDINPLEGEGNKELILCANKNTPDNLIEKAVSVFTEKQFDVFVAKPRKAETFVELFNTYGKNAVCNDINAATKALSTKQQDIEANEVIKQFALLNKQAKEAEKQPYASSRVYASEQINKYAIEIGKNKQLLERVQKAAPKLGSKIAEILKEDREIEL